MTLSLAVVTALDIGIIAAARAVYPEAAAVPPWIAPMIAVVAVSLICAPLLSLISFVRDVTAGPRLDHKQRSEEALADTASAKEQNALVRRGLLRDMTSCYRTHHVSLVQQAQSLLTRNSYDGYDSDALTAELERFQQRTVRPELVLKGYPEADIDAVFEQARDTLIRAVLADAR